MNFRSHHRSDEPEINFIPLIDVLLVVLIFLMVSTTFSQQNPLRINLPSTAKPEKGAETTSTNVLVSVNSDGVYAINQRILENNDISSLAHQLSVETQNINPKPLIVISADARASHQSVVNILEAARLANLGKITFLTQAPK